MSRSEITCSWQQAERFAWEIENPHSGPQLADFVLTMPAHIQVSGVEHALREVARAHDMLRASFVDGTRNTPRMVVEDDVTVRLTDVGMCPTFEVLRELTDRSLDRTQAPLWTATAGIVDDMRCVHIVIEHLVFDGVSLRVLLRSFAAALDGARLSEGPRYAEYCAWQEQRRGTDFWEEDLAFWRSYLGRRTTSPGLRPSFSDPQQVPYASAADVRSWSCPKSADGAIRTLAAAHGITPFKVMLCVMAVTWGQELGVREVNLMVPRAGRPREFVRAIGWFASVLPFVVSWQENTTMNELFERVRVEDRFIEQHQHIPPALLDGMAPAPRPAEVLAFLVDFPDSPLSVPRSSVELHNAVVSAEHKHLDFKFVNSRDRVRLECHFNQRVHEEVGVERMLHTLSHNLEWAGAGRLALP